MSKPRVLVVLPTDWDYKQFEVISHEWRDRIDLELAQPSDDDCPWDFDPIEYIDQMVDRYRGKIDGVTSSSDYPGATIAGAIATRLGLPGSPPDTVIRCSHKYYSRVAQREVVPEATPPFHLVDPSVPDGGAPDLTYPCFIKPVKGAFSVMAQKLSSPEELREFLARPTVQEFATDYVAIFNRLVARLTDFPVNGSFFLAEGFLHGTQVTVEGFEQNGSVHILGIVDSIMHPGTGSFARFDYPSALRPEILERMEEIARRVISRIGLRSSLFNIEMIYEPALDDIHIIEVNPRMCGQFGDLYQKVDGVHGHEVLLALALGERPRMRRGRGAYAAATSFPLRTFEPVGIERVPDRERLTEVEARYPGTLVWWECSEAQDLVDFTRLEDGGSARYGVVNLGGQSRAEMMEKLGAVIQDLSFSLVPLRPGK
jgi:hypothetical protein